MQAIDVDRRPEPFEVKLVPRVGKSKVKEVLEHALSNEL
jgi:hypothetical protein